MPKQPEDPLWARSQDPGPVDATGDRAQADSEPGSAEDPWHAPWCKGNGPSPPPEQGDRDGEPLRTAEDEAEAYDAALLEEAPVDVAALRGELEDARERVLRAQAELDNYRKRAHRTLEDERRFAGLPLIRDLLNVVDNLRRAIEAAREHDDNAGLLAGVEMVAEQLASILQQHHCEEIPTAGEHFDPHVHEAIGQTVSDDLEPGQVALVAQVGYQLHGRVIRPSQVIVAAARTEDE